MSAAYGSTLWPTTSSSIIGSPLSSSTLTSSVPDSEAELHIDEPRDTLLLVDLDTTAPDPLPEAVARPLRCRNHAIGALCPLRWNRAGAVGWVEASVCGWLAVARGGGREKAFSAAGQVAHDRAGGPDRGDAPNALTRE